MNQTITLLKQIAPELTQYINQRFDILEGIYSCQPIGRRTLSEEIGLSERILRNEIQVLKEQQLIRLTSKGMLLTTEGNDVLEQLKHIVQGDLHLEKKARRLAKHLNIHHCVIKTGDADQAQNTREEIGRAVAELLMNRLPEAENIIGVTGGRTMAYVAQELTDQLSHKRDLTFVPARGGTVEEQAIQANTISEEMAKNTNGKNQMLLIPEIVSAQIKPLLIEEPAIRKTLNILYKANCILFSIADAQRMAKRRNTPPETIEILKEKEAVGEAFGEYFNRDGEVVYKVPQIGISPSRLETLPLVIASAGGQSKAEAIEAYAKKAPKNLILVTDEGAANKILMHA